MDAEHSRRFRSEEVPTHPDWKTFERPSVFPASTPIDLEIGCGVGWHPIRYARENPDRFLIAIERTREKFESFARRLETHAPLPNLLAVHADAVNWVTHCLRPGQISRCFLLYPNPSPQNPSQRWIRMPFLDRLAEVLEPGGEIRLVTNLAGYFDELRSWAPRRGLHLANEWVFDRHLVPEGLPRTHFEKKYLERGDRCFEGVLKRGLDPLLHSQ